MLHYERQGSGEVLVLIHGFLGSRQVFDKVFGPLQENFDVIRIDFPGHGKSELQPEHQSVYDYAQEIVEVLKHEYVEEAYWLGHSMGGYILLAALEKELHPIKKAILAYSSETADSEETKDKRDKQQAKIRENGSKAFVDEALPGFFSQHAQQNDIQFAKEVAYEATEAGLIAALGAMKTRNDQHKLIEETDTPILVLQGKHDKVVPPIETANPLVKKVVTDTGHLGMLEDPEAFVKAVIAFLK